jgi:hypothetical protein
MRRRPLALGTLLAVALAASGCGGSATGDQAKRKTFLQAKDVEKLKDEELARLCPSLYPTDFLARPKHYRYTRAKKRFVPNASQRTEAQAAGCTAQGTKPKK